MIYDVVLFFNETELYDMRLLELEKIVDCFVVIEAKKTFSLIEKEQLNFNWNSDIVIRNLSKIKYFVIDFDSKNPWDNETYQRNFAHKFLLQNMKDSDFVILSDLDEIPFADKLKSVNYSCRLQMDLYYYSLEWLSHEKWYLALFLKKEAIEKTNSLEDLRRKVFNLPILANAGRHLSYFMSPDQIRTKIESFSHQEFNKKEYKDTIEESIRLGRDPFHRCYFSKTDIHNNT